MKKCGQKVVVKINFDIGSTVSGLSQDLEAKLNQS